MVKTSSVPGDPARCKEGTGPVTRLILEREKDGGLINFTIVGHINVEVPILYQRITNFLFILNEVSGWGPVLFRCRYLVWVVINLELGN